MEYLPLANAQPIRSISRSLGPRAFLAGDYSLVVVEQLERAGRHGAHLSGNITYVYASLQHKMLMSGTVDSCCKAQRSRLRPVLSGRSRLCVRFRFARWPDRWLAIVLPNRFWPRYRILRGNSC